MSVVWWKQCGEGGDDALSNQCVGIYKKIIHADITSPLLTSWCSYAALEKWTSHLQSLHSAVVGRVI